MDERSPKSLQKFHTIVHGRLLRKYHFSQTRKRLYRPGWRSDCDRRRRRKYLGSHIQGTEFLITKNQIFLLEVRFELEKTKQLLEIQWNVPEFWKKSNKSKIMDILARKCLLTKKKNDFLHIHMTFIDKKMKNSPKFNGMYINV